MLHLFDYHPDDIDVHIAELLTATHESADPLVHPKVSEVLRILRQKLNMDVVFVSQFQDGKRTFRVVESARHNTKVVAGQSDPLEESWCQHVVTGRLPELIRDAAPLVASGQAPDPGEPIGTHLSTPILLQNGAVFGTLCCYSQGVKDSAGDLDLRRLKITAQHLADELGKSGVGKELQLTPTKEAPRR